MGSVMDWNTYMNTVWLCQIYSYILLIIYYISLQFKKNIIHIHIHIHILYIYNICMCICICIIFFLNCNDI